MMDAICTINRARKAAKDKLERISPRTFTRFEHVLWPQNIVALCLHVVLLRQQKVSDELSVDRSNACSLAKSEHKWTETRLRDALFKSVSIDEVTELVLSETLFILCDRDEHEERIFAPFRAYLQAAICSLERLRTSSEKVYVALYSVREMIHDIHDGEISTLQTWTYPSHRKEIKYSSFCHYLEQLETVHELDAFLRYWTRHVLRDFSQGFFKETPSRRNDEKMRQRIYRAVLQAYAKLDNTNRRTVAKILSRCRGLLTKCFGAQLTDLPKPSETIAGLKVLKENLKELARHASSRFVPYLGVRPDDLRSRVIQICVKILHAPEALHLHDYLDFLESASLDQYPSANSFRLYFHTTFVQYFEEVHRVLSHKEFFSAAEAEFLQRKVGSKYNYMIAIWQAFERMDTGLIPADALHDFLKARKHRQSHEEISKAQCKVVLRFCRLCPSQAIAIGRKEMVENDVRQVALFEGLEIFFRQVESSIFGKSISSDAKIFRRRKDVEVDASVIVTPTAILLGGGSAFLDMLGDLVENSYGLSQLFRFRALSVSDFTKRFPALDGLKCAEAGLRPMRSRRNVLSESILERCGSLQFAHKDVAHEISGLRSVLEKVAQHLGFEHNAALEDTFDHVEEQCKHFMIAARKSAEADHTAANFFARGGDGNPKYIPLGRSLTSVTDVLFPPQTIERLRSRNDQASGGHSGPDNCPICLEENRVEVRVVVCRNGHSCCNGCFQQVQASSNGAPPCFECREPCFNECLPLKLLCKKPNEGDISSTRTSKRATSNANGLNGARKRARYASSSTA